jgi:DNA polymerase III alpha subunit (gram-positive type)
LINHHRANADALATAKIFINLLADLQSRGVQDLGTAQKFDLNKNYVGPSQVTTGESSTARYQADAA